MFNLQAKYVDFVVVVFCFKTYDVISLASHILYLNLGGEEGKGLGSSSISDLCKLHHRFIIG